MQLQLGKLSPTNDSQKQLLFVLNEKKSAETAIEKAWLKYQKVYQQKA